MSDSIPDPTPTQEPPQDPTHEQHNQAVRFSSVTQEISPSDKADSIHPVKTAADPSHNHALSEEQKKELRDISISLQQSRMQSFRMDQFVFDPVSLPPSRVPSGGSSNNAPITTRLSPRSSPMSRGNSQTLLTPADSGSKDDKASASRPMAPPMPVTPQISPLPDGSSRDRKPSPAAEARAISRPKSMTEMGGAVPAHPKQAPTQLALPRGDSNPTSQDNSPLSTPREVPSGSQTPYSRPFTPVGDPNDPYARARRPPPARNLDNIDARFVFGKERPRSAFFPGTASPGRGGSVIDFGKPTDDKRASFFGGKRESDEAVSGGKKGHAHHHHSSMSDLKRFFKLGGSKKDKRDKSPAPAIKFSKPSKSSGTATPPSRSSSAAALPFADDHGLEAKYGKFEKILGSGAGGSVRLMKRADGVTFAVKQFRDRHAWETEKAYNKKITAEFCIGSTLHHGNIIEAMDIVNEKGRWYEVMEYAPYDLFAIVMTGKMSREEVACCMMQIVNGVAYLHGMGLAHRDLKLDNVVVNEHGIMKIIDFGSAHVFQYPFEGGIVMAEGVVGSDPYLAPEVFTQKSYDAQKVDIWSLAIIFCCMSLRRFPWKCPKTTDNSFRLFITQPTEEELRHPLYPQRPHAQPEPASRNSTHVAPGNGASENADSPSSRSHHHHSHNSSQPESRREASVASKGEVNPSNILDDRASTATATTAAVSTTTTSSVPNPPQPITLKGPWRLLRLLPRETRHIIGRMLEVDPLKRATLDDILSDPWVARTPFCRQEVGGTVFRANGHTHVLEGSGGS